MADVTALELRINQLNEALEEMREATREAHVAIKGLRDERKQIQQILQGKEVKDMVNDRVNEVVKTELDKIGPEIRRRTNLIYERVGEQINKLIDLSLGKEFATAHNRSDVRPELAAKLREWIKEVTGLEEASDESTT